MFLQELGFFGLLGSWVGDTLKKLSMVRFHPVTSVTLTTFTTALSPQIWDTGLLHVCIQDMRCFRSRPYFASFFMANIVLICFDMELICSFMVTLSYEMKALDTV